jgi:MYXO-CTERM domain-containing protein
LNILRAAYVSGSNPLMEGQTTRVTFTYEIRNLLNVTLDFNGTVVFDLGDGVSVVSAIPTRGTAMVTGQRLNWDGFVLGPGESASITVTADVTPPAGSAGNVVVVVDGVLATARTPTGSIVEVRGGALTSDLISGLANGGLVVARAGVVPVGPAPVAPGAAAAVIARPAAGTGGPGAATTVTLPRTGTGMTADSSLQRAIPYAAALVALSALGAGLLWRRRREDQ